MTDMRIKCSACLKKPATQENFKKFHGFWCDGCVEKAKQELLAKRRGSQ